MEAVTPEELAAALDRITDVFEVGLAKIAVQACGTKQDHFSRSEAAEYLRISQASLDRLTAVGEIRRAKLGDGPKATVLYRRADLNAFVESRLECDRKDAGERVKRIKL